MKEQAESLSSRKAVVTGGGSGIGSSIVHRLDEEGCETFTADIEIPENHPGHSFQVDLTKKEQVEQFQKTVRESAGEPDILVCNAGRGIHEKLSEGDPDRWEEIFRLNVMSALRLIRAFVPGMADNGSGDVIFVSSVSSRHPYTYGGIYTATKAAIDMIAETLRLEEQPEIRVTVIHPGVVDTKFFEHMVNGTQTAESIGWGAVDPGRVADAIIYALRHPAGTSLNDIVIRPTAQPM